MPVAIILENLEYGATIDEIAENYRVTREQLRRCRNSRPAALPLLPRSREG